MFMGKFFKKFMHDLALTIHKLKHLARWLDANKALISISCFTGISAILCFVLHFTHSY